MTLVEQTTTRPRAHALAALLVVVSLLGMHGVVAVCLHHLTTSATTVAAAAAMPVHDGHAAPGAAATLVDGPGSSSVPMDDETGLLALCLAVLAGLTLAFALTRAEVRPASTRLHLVGVRLMDRFVRGPPGLYRLAVLRL
jgi:hypothetical protein